MLQHKTVKCVERADAFHGIAWLLSWLMTVALLIASAQRGVAQEIEVRYSFKTSGSRWVAFSPDGKWFAFADCPKGMQLWDLDKGKKWMAASPSGITVWDDESGKGRIVVRYGDNDLCGDKLSIDCMAFSPDGKTLAYCCDGYGYGGVRFLDVASGKVKETVLVRRRVSKVLVFAPDGKSLATSDGSLRAFL